MGEISEKLRKQNGLLERANDTYLFLFDRFVKELVEAGFDQLCWIESLKQPDQELNADRPCFSRIFVILYHDKA